MASARAMQGLRRFTSCDIGDALVKLKYPYGGFLDGIKMFSPGASGRIFGPAVTVQMVAMSDTSAPKLDKHFVDHNEDGSVMYIQQPKDVPSACWGGLMSTRAKWLGAQGVVIDGRMRDISEHREMEFPASWIPLATNCFKNDLWINPGDIMVADEDGVVVTPPSLVEQVVALCQERAEIDEKMFTELRKGAAMGPLIKSLRNEK
ncbi:hypothetical protein JX265_000536 [Neoarthrinium moseri]|uniref:Uncharacterized protein n=1 Tax=Neoarthrinium moseri TaxID=1658444 RepID=A0A9P9WZA4_9PEZI|nr:hypothetical protein JX266_013314 [Neoarthrinium moseri]KAI1881710.1 hypothetical protein JX265_000536 [Neoarthrinium moseri]